MTSQDEYFERQVRTRHIRLAVRTICFSEGRILVQRPSDDATCYAFIGGLLEFGESLVERVRTEYMEEWGRQVTRADYLFVAENRFVIAGGMFHSIEHYFLVELDSYTIESCEPHLEAHWLHAELLPTFDVRPHVVRDAVANGSWAHVKHLVVPF